MILITVSGIILVGTVLTYLVTLQKPGEEIKSTLKTELRKSEPESAPKQSILFVDVSGAVNRPNVYRLPVGSRVYAAIDAAGGLSDEVDSAFTRRNVNFARLISDQEKIYIPTTADVQSGIVDEYVKMVDQTDFPSDVPKGNEINLKVNINTSVIEELDQLPGIGPTYAQKIIDNRPYSSIEDLLTKKILKKSAYTQIKDLVSLE
jgi:competence protein ComEA